MGRDKRLYPISEEKFTEVVLPIIEASYLGKGRPPKPPTTGRFAVFSIY
jgi:hypothetical protein